MPRSGPRSNSDAFRRLDRDDAGVSEIVGYILMFGILSMITILAMLTFSEAQDGASDRVVELRADSAAERVASIVVQAALFGEAYEDHTPDFRRHIELLQQFESKSYEISLRPSDADGPDRVEVYVSAISYTTTAPLFSASAPGGIELCPSSTGGGSILVRLDEAPPAPCAGLSVYLESA